MNIKQYNTTNKQSRSGYVPKFICWHIADGTLNGTLAWEQNPQSQVSSHFILGKNGEVYQMVPLNMAAWTQGGIRNPTHPYVKTHQNINPNLYCVSIECEGYWKDTKGKLTDAQFKSAVELTKHQGSADSGSSQTSSGANDTKYHYTVQVGSYKNSINADSMYREIANMGYFAFKQSVSGNTRVCVGKFETRDEAEITRKDLLKKGYEGFTTALNV